MATAPMVPTGIDRWASARSPDRFDPAMIPVDKEIKNYMARETSNITSPLTSDLFLAGHEL